MISKDLSSKASATSNYPTSSIQNNFKYDVFLSFRGEDTRKNFVDHLYTALHQQGIYTYKDDEKLDKGKRINDELLTAIEDSKFSIIVFSKNYASSSWCLDELVKIMECQKTNDQAAYPIFYDVEPTEVRNQRGAVGKAFTKCAKEVAAGKWKCALEEAANLGGWELKNTAHGHEAKAIQIIVDHISAELHSARLSVNERFMAMDARMQDLKKVPKMMIFWKTIPKIGLFFIIVLYGIYVIQECQVVFKSFFMISR